MSYQNKSFQNALLDKIRLFNNVAPVVVAYTLIRAREFNPDCAIADIITHIPDKSVQCLVKEQITDDVWNSIHSLCFSYSLDEMVNFALTYDEGALSFRSNETTPDSLIDLAFKLLNISQGDSVADFGCGTGRFLVKASSLQPQANYCGYDISTRAVEIAKIRAELSGHKFSVLQQNLFTISKQNFDRIFSNYPWKVLLKFVGENHHFISELKQKCPHLSGVSSSDWLFNALICNNLAPNGKGIGIMLTGSTWNSKDAAIRKYFVEQGLIEAIIALPSRLFYNTGVATCLIVLSNNNKHVRMIDATQLYKAERRKNTLSAQHITQIVKAYQQDSEYSRLVSVAEIDAQDYNLFPEKFFDKKVHIAHPVLLMNLANSISRAPALSAAELDDLISVTPTPYRHLTLTDINNGMVSNDLRFLKRIPKRCNASLITTDTLVLSKNAPYKVAVIHPHKNESILASGNLYLISLNPQKAHPHYIQAFLSSETGQRLLKQVSVGSFLINLSLSAFQNLTIPNLPLKQQAAVAQRLLCAQDEVRLLKLKLEKAEKALQTIWESSEEVA